MAELLTVLQSFPSPRPTTNPYLVMLAKALESKPQLTVLNFRWRTALTARYDVFHVHWPEVMITGGKWHKRAVRQVLFAALLIRLRLMHTPIVRTQHNIARPTGLNSVQQFLLSRFETQTAFIICLNNLTPVAALSTTITHGDYREWFADYNKPQSVPGRFGFAGLIRQYKGVELLLTAFGALVDPRLSLTISGNPSRDEIARTLQEMAGTDSRVRLDLRFLPDQDFVNTVAESEIMVFPYTFMHNSGGVLAALSLNRRVLVPDNNVNRELAAEVGPEWFSFFNGRLGPEDLVRALESGRTTLRGPQPNLSARSWDHVADDHLRAYVRAMKSLRGARQQ